MSLVADIRRQAQRGGSASKLKLKLADGEKLRIRFLTDMEDGLKVQWHDKFEAGIDTPCLEHYGQKCEYCELTKDECRKRPLYVWPVWVYDLKEIRYFIFPSHDTSPVMALVSYYDVYGSIMNHDFVISRTGKMLDTTYNIIPLAESEFKLASKVKTPTPAKIMEELANAHGVDMDGGGSSKKAAPMASLDDDDDEDDMFGDDE